MAPVTSRSLPPAERTSEEEGEAKAKAAETTTKTETTRNGDRSGGSETTATTATTTITAGIMGRLGECTGGERQTHEQAENHGYRDFANFHRVVLTFYDYLRVNSSNSNTHSEQGQDADRQYFCFLFASHANFS